MESASVLTCPSCGASRSGEMPDDRRVVRYLCGSCGAELRPEEKRLLRLLLLRLTSVSAGPGERRVPVILPESPPREAEISGHYDELDPLYRELWGEDLHHGLWKGSGDDVAAAVRRLTDRVAEAAGIREGDRVCDVGCGHGRMAEVLAREWGTRAGPADSGSRRWRT